MDHSESRPPLADDLSFLDDLDRALDGDVPARLEPRREARVPSGPAGFATPRRRRPLLDLFPPTQVAAHPAPRHVTAPPPPAAAASLAYESFYGLNEKPFNLTPDPKFHYHSASHDRAAQEILSAIGRREAIVVLTGDIGSGKTTLCRAVSEQIDRRTFTSFVVDPFVSITDLLKTVLIDFGVISRTDLSGGRLRGGTRQELTIVLREFLLSLAPLNGFAMIFIDEAQNLSPEMLEHLREIADVESDKGLIQIVLIGQPGLLTTLRQRDLDRFNQRVSVRCELGPLAEGEMAGYVSHRLAVAGGGQSRVAFDSGAFTCLYDLTRGLPRLVNRLCDRVLALGYEQSATVIDAAMIEAAARDVVIVPDALPAKMMRLGVGALLFMVLMLMGAGAATLVFRPQMRRLVAAWQAVPPPPQPPAMSVVAPIDPVPEQVDPRPGR